MPLASSVIPSPTGGKVEKDRSVQPHAFFVMLVIEMLLYESLSWLSFALATLGLLQIYGWAMGCCRIASRAR